ncbi:MAG: hypothetical protein WBY53_17025 [Acidobacteriaceae bacterium]
MNDRAEGGNGLTKAIQFIRAQGLYLFVCELGQRAGILWRRLMFARKLGCPTIVLGPRCHLRGLSHIRIGRNFQTMEGLWLEAVAANQGRKLSPSIVIGDNVSVSRSSHIAATNRIEIGDGVLIGSRVLITDHNHGDFSGTSPSPGIQPSVRPLSCDKAVIIGRNVWIGDGVVVTPGSRIGEGVVIGANSVVTGTIPPFTLAAGVPAKLLKQYDFSKNEWVRIG